MAAPRRNRRWLTIAGLLILAGAGAYAVTRLQTPVADRNDLLFHTVRAEPLKLTVVERGALESADNRDVVCKVRVGSRSNLTIKWVVEDGTYVKQGQLLVELDDSAFQDALKDQKIRLDQAKAAMVQAEESYNIVLSQNQSDILTAQVAVELARLDLEKYTDGEYLQSRKDIQNRILLAESDCELQRERVDYTERMVKMNYLGVAQLRSEESKLRSLEVNLAKVKEEQRVLEDYTKKRTVTDLTNKLEETRRAFERVKLQAHAKEVQSEIDRISKRSVYTQEESKYLDLEEQIANCRIYAPQEGMVVYFVSEQSRFGSGSSQSIIAVGEPVKEGQKLMRIPDLRRMVVATKVHEAMVSRVRGDQWKPTGFADVLRSSVMASQPDGLARVLAAHALTDQASQFREYELQKLGDGQPATIRVDAFPDRLLRGHVKSVATVASQQDWSSADVKVYQTMVAIDESLENLKPGMSAEVTILIDTAGEEVLTLPLQAVVGGAELGPKRKCYVKKPDGPPEERDIVIGLANEKVAEVRSGLQAGEQVVVNPRVLLGDKAKVRSATESAAPGGERKSRGPGGGKGKPPAAPKGN